MYGFARGAQVFAYMERIEQVVALRTELVFNLVGDPRRTIAYAVNIGLAVEAGAVGTFQKLGASRIHIALQGAAIARRFTSLSMRQANLGFFPEQTLALALVVLRRIGLHDGHHSTIHLNNDLRSAAGRWFRWIFGSLRRLKYLSGVPLSDASYRAFA